VRDKAWQPVYVSEGDPWISHLFFLRMMFSCLQKQARLKLMHTLVTMLPAEKEEEEEEEVSLLNSN